MFIHCVMYLHLPHKLNDIGEFFSVTVQKRKELILIQFTHK